MDFWKDQLKNLFNDERLDGLIKSLDQQLEHSLKEFDQHLNHFHSNYFFQVESTEDENEIIIEATLPVGEEDKVKLDMVNHQLRILIQRFETEQIQNNNGELLKKENFSKRIERYLPLPANVDTESIKAAMSGNRLTVKIPKIVKQSQIIDIDLE
ncbi:Hsp20/alpha crystallin family protein [Pseudalkalibacillus berkeleyi]|uniref:Hsp20/alpha crystallin family protein n=1 Tax=Pseudalkalibacillus berkeleyi TaxID=1069813 RepID=A0ABS9H0Q3_9BACL|nr:Hsp20/alpha crystallin family protein [Pseudalkalibacillus berkeleyi]MCF6137377.1 Hsp20/alpha crystallin family protein [Pseudalkalibacillus berkeleyi]